MDTIIASWQQRKWRTMTQRPRFIVVYDLSAAGPAEIVASLAQLGEVTFAVNPSSFTTPLVPLLRDLADVVMLDEPRALERLRSAHPSGIITFSDRMVRKTAWLAAELGLPYHSPDTAELLTSKYGQRRRLHGRGVGTARTALLDEPSRWQEAVRWIGLPAVLKPVHGEGSRNTYKIEDEQRGRALVEELLGTDGTPKPRETALVLETFIDGKDCRPFADYVSVESIVSHGVVSHLGVTGKFLQPPPFREVGQFWPALLGMDDKHAVLDLTQRAIEALDVRTGVLHTEIKLTDHGPEVIEVNGRLGGMIDKLCLTATGLDLIELAGRLALGEDVELPELSCSGVTFQHCTLAPTEPCRLDEIHGAARVRRTPAISAYRTRVRPGTELEGGVGTRYLDYLCGTAANHDAMLAFLDEVLEELSFSFTLPSGRITRSALSLSGRRPREGSARPEETYSDRSSGKGSQ
ncbi:ATP-grasp domain-containing protein [Streptomyces sp. NPDC052107]|uniref:ATP-grasp domain-containing protein n=1 Tax=Streptomyces sp. NPDC052107 TaxID=3155632 RepID=UPI00341B0B71